MKWVLFIIILAPCYALETIICERLSGFYDCQVWSESEPEYLEGVIQVYESDGMNTSVQDDDEEEEDIARNETSREDYYPLIFPFSPFKW